MGGIKIQNRRPRSDATLLLAVGFILFATGIALVAAPQYSQRARDLADFLARFAGLQSGVLLLGGLVFFSLGVLSRAIQRMNSAPRFTPSRPSREDGGDASRAVERLAADMAQLRAIVEQVAGDVERSSATLQHVLQAQESLGQIQGQQVAPGSDPQPVDGDPLFKLAGSLDHMNARLDERMNALTARLEELLAPGGPGVTVETAGAAETGGHDLGGSPSASGAASGADGIGPLELLVSEEDDPDATGPSDFFEGVEDPPAPTRRAPAKKTASKKKRTKRSGGSKR